MALVQAGKQRPDWSHPLQKRSLGYYIEMRARWRFSACFTDTDTRTPDVHVSIDKNKVDKIETTTGTLVKAFTTGTAVVCSAVAASSKRAVKKQTGGSRG